jgi:hypothetical protein
MADEGVWEALASEGLSILQDHDRNRWRLGEIAQLVERGYGKSALRNFANDINIRPPTLYEYHRVTAFYSPDDRDTFPMLTWSHYRAAMKMDYDAAIDALTHASDIDMRIGDFTDYVRMLCEEAPKPRVLATITGYVIEHHPVDGTITLSVECNDWSVLLDEAPVRLQVLDHVPEQERV